MRCRAGTVLGLAVLTAAIAAPAAVGADTRAGYVAAADPICRDFVAQVKRLNRRAGPVKLVPVDPDARKPTQRELNRGRQQLGRLMSQTNRAFGTMVSRLAFIAAPAGDEQRIADWLTGLRAYRRMTDRAVQRFKRGRFNKAGLLFRRSSESFLAATLLVYDWGFKTCPAGTRDEQNIVP